MWAWLACGADPLPIRESPPPPPEVVEDSGDPEVTASEPTGPESTADTSAPPRCPEGMADLGAFCIDRWEAHRIAASPYEVPVDGVAASAEGAVPQGYVSGLVAAELCAAAGKRLCTVDEWERACGGPEGTLYPYGETYDPGACNDTRSVHPMIELFGGDVDWSTTQMNDPRLNQLPDSLAAAGANPGCVSAEGVHDLHGNLHEWVDDPEGTFRGGFYVDAVLNGPGCSYRTGAHSVDYHDYSTGFRCCSD